MSPSPAPFFFYTSSPHYSLFVSSSNILAHTGSGRSTLGLQSPTANSKRRKGCEFSCAQTCMHACTHTHMYIYIYIHTNAHMHAHLTLTSKLLKKTLALKYCSDSSMMSGPSSTANRHSMCSSNTTVSQRQLSFAQLRIKMAHVALCWQCITNSFLRVFQDKWCIGIDC